MEPNNTERICITWLECSSLIRYWTQSFIILKKLRIWDIEPNNSVNISTTSQATNLILIRHRALKKTSVMVQKGQKSQKVDIEPDNSQPTICQLGHQSHAAQTLFHLENVLLSMITDKRTCNSGTCSMPNTENNKDSRPIQSTAIKL